MSKVDETIDVICIWIKNQLELNTGTYYNIDQVIEMVQALAELVSASKKAVWEKESYKRSVLQDKNQGISEIKGITVELTNCEDTGMNPDQLKILRDESKKKLLELTMRIPICESASFPEEEN